MSKKGSSRKGDDQKHWPRITNRRARYDYHLLEKIEAGIELRGTEVKSLREGRASLDGAYAQIRNGEVFLCGATIAEYPQAAGALQHDPTRDRKLLLHSREIRKLQAHVQQKGHTIIPLAIYFRRGWAKCELATAVGKRKYDKRHVIQEREMEREIQREISRRKK